MVAVTGYRPQDLEVLGELVSEQRHNPRFSELGNVYSLWCARDVVAGGCLIVNSDVLFEDEVARRLLSLEGSAVLCDSSHGVDEESMKAVSEDGRLVRLSKHAPVQSNPEYIGLARVDPTDGPLLAQILDEFVESGRLDVYYEDALEELARRQPAARRCRRRAGLDRDRRPRRPRTRPRRGAGAGAMTARPEGRTQRRLGLAPPHRAAALPAQGARDGAARVRAQLGLRTSSASRGRCC